jgi:hypothetical protein
MRYLTHSMLVHATGVLLVVACSSSTGEPDGGSGSGGIGTGGLGGGTGAMAGGAGATGKPGTGSDLGTGGKPGMGGKPGTGGGLDTGGKPGMGKPGTGGGLDTGGKPGTGGPSGGTGGSAPCKRGIAANTAPGAAFFPGVGWWYNWAMEGSGAKTGIEFVPMVWGSGSLKASVPSGARFLLTFNEPNFMSQANLSATQAASYWPTIESKAAGLPIVGPGMNYCGPADQCHGTDPYQYYKDFIAACTDCQVDYVAVHWYNCDLPSLKDYLETGGSLPGFEQFDRPIWLTEFSCDGKASMAEQEAYMRAAIPYLDGNPKVFRYSWFSADPIPNAKLIDADGSPTALGQVYISLPGGCS